MATTKEIEKRTYSISEAAKALTIRNENIEILLKKGYIGYLNFGQRRIPKPEVERFMLENMGVDFKEIFEKAKQEKGDSN